MLSAIRLFSRTPSQCSVCQPCLLLRHKVFWVSKTIFSVLICHAFGKPNALDDIIFIVDTIQLVLILSTQLSNSSFNADDTFWICKRHVKYKESLLGMRISLEILKMAFQSKASVDCAPSYIAVWMVSARLIFLSMSRFCRSMVLLVICRSRKPFICG